MPCRSLVISIFLCGCEPWTLLVHHEKKDPVFRIHGPCLSTMKRRIQSSVAVNHGPCLSTMKRRIQSFESKCPWKLLRISYLELKINDCVRSNMSTSLWVHRNLFRQLSKDGNLHVTRHQSLSKAILQNTWEGGRRRGLQRKCWMDNIKEGTSLPMPALLKKASCKKDWKRIFAESSFMSPRPPSRSWH